MRDDIYHFQGLLLKIVLQLLQVLLQLLKLILGLILHPYFVRTQVVVCLIRGYHIVGGVFYLALDAVDQVLGGLKLLGQLAYLVVLF